MKIRDVMSVEPETILPTATIKRAAQRMNKYHIGALIVITPGFEVIGIITERDILRAFAGGKKPETPVSEIMTKGVVTIDENSTLKMAADKMIEYDIKRVVVTKKGRCVGIISATDIIAYETRLKDKMIELMRIPQKVSQGG